MGCQELSAGSSLIRFLLVIILLIHLELITVLGRFNRNRKLVSVVSKILNLCLSRNTILENQSKSILVFCSGLIGVFPSECFVPGMIHILQDIHLPDCLIWLVIRSISYGVFQIHRYAGALAGCPYRKGTQHTNTAHDLLLILIRIEDTGILYLHTYLKTKGIVVSAFHSVCLTTSKYGLITIHGHLVRLIRRLHIDIFNILTIIRIKV